MQNIIVSQEKNKNIQDGIGTPAGGIPESL